MELEKQHFINRSRCELETKNVLLPWNYDSKVSASNLRSALLGKSLTSKAIQPKSILKKRKIEEDVIQSNKKSIVPKVSKINAVQPKQETSNDREDK